MNINKLKKNETVVRTGGKGSVRRKKRVVRRAGGGEDKKLQAALRRINMNPIPVDQVLMYKSDGQVIEFNNPRLQANIPGNTFVISGRSNTRAINADDLETTLPGFSKIVEKAKENKGEEFPEAEDFETTAETGDQTGEKTEETSEKTEETGEKTGEQTAEGTTETEQQQS